MKMIIKYGTIFLNLVWLLILSVYEIQAQLPTHYPDPTTDPPRLTLINILVYFVTPLLLIVIWYFFRRNQRKKREQEKQEEKK